MVAQASLARPTIQRVVTRIRRPEWVPQVRYQVKLGAGQHRRHVVMSSRMREAIFQYHSAVDEDRNRRDQRRAELQSFVGGSGTLRTEMMKATELVHNSMGNLFPGPGGPNTAIGFAVEPLYRIADEVRDVARNGTTPKVIEAARTKLQAWADSGIFGFAAEHKAELAGVFTEWANALDPAEDSPNEIVKMIEYFGDSCSFDVPYVASDDGDDRFPDHIDRVVNAQLIAVATTLNNVIGNPKGNHNLYGDSCLGYLLKIAQNYPSSSSSGATSVSGSSNDPMDIAPNNPQSIASSSPATSPAHNTRSHSSRDTATNISQ
jgi:hypothetical protein